MVILKNDGGDVEFADPDFLQLLKIARRVILSKWITLN